MAHGNITGKDAIEDEKLGLLFTARIAVPNPRLKVDDKCCRYRPA